MAGYDGDGSYWKLLDEYYSLNVYDFPVNQKEYDVTVRLDELNQVLLFSFVRAGQYKYTDGTQDNRKNYSLYSQKTPRASGTGNYFLYGAHRTISYSTASYKGIGRSVRCVTKSFSCIFLFFSHKPARGAPNYFYNISVRRKSFYSSATLHTFSLDEC